MHNYIFSLYPDTKAIFQREKSMQCRFSESALLLTTDNLLPDYQDLTWKKIYQGNLYPELFWFDREVLNTSHGLINLQTLFAKLVPTFLLFPTASSISEIVFSPVRLTLLTLREQEFITTGSQHLINPKTKKIWLLKRAM